MVIIIPSRAKIIVIPRMMLIEDRLFDTTLLLPNSASTKTESIFCVVFFIVDLLLDKDRI